PESFDVYWSFNQGASGGTVARGHENPGQSRISTRRSGPGDREGYVLSGTRPPLQASRGWIRDRPQADRTDPQFDAVGAGSARDRLQQHAQPAPQDLHADAHQ